MFMLHSPYLASRPITMKHFMVPAPRRISAASGLSQFQFEIILSSAYFYILRLFVVDGILSFQSYCLRSCGGPLCCTEFNTALISLICVIAALLALCIVPATFDACPWYTVSCTVKSFNIELELGRAISSPLSFLLANL